MYEWYIMNLVPSSLVSYKYMSYEKRKDFLITWASPRMKLIPLSSIRTSSILRSKLLPRSLYGQILLGDQERKDKNVARRTHPKECDMAVMLRRRIIWQSYFGMCMTSKEN